MPLALGCGGEADESSTGDSSMRQLSSSPSFADSSSPIPAKMNTDLEPADVTVSDPVVRADRTYSQAEAMRGADTDHAAEESGPAKSYKKSAPESEERTPEREQRTFTGRNQRFQAGTLTAGSIDDNKTYEEYRTYLSTAMQSQMGRKCSGMFPRQRIVIEVNDKNGIGIGNARIAVRHLDPQSQDSPASEKPILELPTGTDGKALFLPGIDSRKNASEFHLTVSSPDNSRHISKRVSINQAPWQITLPENDARLPQALDLALVIDTTGSMKDELEYLKTEIDDIAASIHSRFPNVKQRFSLILYRDDGDQYVTRMFDFTGSLTTFRQQLSNQHADGGGDYPEAMHLALEQAEKLSWRNDNSARVLFLVGDAPPHDNVMERTFQTVNRLRTSGVSIFPVAASGVKDKAEFLMRAASFVTMGEYLFLTDHSGVGNPHAKPHTPRYDVEKLNQLMIRMIASELAGRKIPAHEIIAFQEGDTQPALQRSKRAARQFNHTISYSHKRRGTQSGSTFDREVTFRKSFLGSLSWLGICVMALLIIIAEKRWAA